MVQLWETLAVICDNLSANFQLSCSATTGGMRHNTVPTEINVMPSLISFDLVALGFNPTCVFTNNSYCIYLLLRHESGLWQLEVKPELKN